MVGSADPVVPSDGTGVAGSAGGTASSEVADVAVVGRGLIGAAAARHLAEAGHRVVAVGPDEPADRSSWPGPFSSHGDEGRITRIASPSSIWSHVALRSIERYADLEQRTGLSIHRPCGLVLAAPPAEVEDWVATGAATGADIEPVDRDHLAAITGIVVPDGQDVAREGPPAGMINPRRLARAQTELARRAGATIVTEVVESITTTGDVVEVGGAWGSLRARRVLVATGAFGHGLLGRPLAAVRIPRTVLLVELDGPGDGPSPDALPSLIARQTHDERIQRIYWVPPTPYPDGRRYLKIGGSLVDEPEIAAGPGHDPDAELIDFFHTDGFPVEAEALHNCVAGLLPGFTIGSTVAVPCVYTGTPSGLPAIDWVDDRVAVAIGGNGSAAKSSDELGRLAAVLVTAGDLAGEPGPDGTGYGDAFAATWR